jgi:hypothetical protein
MTRTAAMAPDGSSTAWKIADNATANDYYGIQQIYSDINSTSVFKFYAKAAEYTWIGIRSRVNVNYTWVNLATCVAGTKGATATISVADTGDGWCSITYSSPYPGAAITPGVWGASANGAYQRLGSVGSGFFIWHPHLNLGSTATAYQKTLDSREWALETTGNYVGILTGFYRYNRVFTHGEVYRVTQYLKSRINAAGGLIP